MDWIFGVNLKAPEIVDDDCCDKASKPDVYRCNECNLIFPELTFLVKHVELEHSKTEI
ncbi:hypothetical protein KAJ27_12700 [bacterium]|nr:hypothetical protein [bacterium]